MKSLLGFWLIFESTTVAFGASTNGISDGSEKLTVVWTAATNDWQEKLWTYKVSPQKFSPSVISNILTIGGFTKKDRAKVPQSISEMDKNAIFYGHLEGTYKHLAICPSLGSIDYYDPTAKASSHFQKVEGVPNEQEATLLGLECLRICGIDISQIARKPGSCKLDLRWEKNTLTYTDQKTQKEIVETNSYGVLFNRCIDGVKVNGYARSGGVRVRFGNSAKLVDLQICWRNLQPHELLTVPSPQQIAEQLRDGKLLLHPLGTAYVYPFEEVKKLTVIKCTFYYEGKYYDEPMDFVRPFISFEGIADNGKTATGVWFEWCL